MAAGGSLKDRLTISHKQNNYHNNVLELIFIMGEKARLMPGKL
jgi:hypothetical protein